MTSFLIAVALVGGAVFGAYRLAKYLVYGKESVPAAVSIKSLTSGPKTSVTEIPVLTKSPTQKLTNPTDTPTPTSAAVPIAPIMPTPAASEPTPLAQIPPELNLAMTFYSQAPFKDWNEPWQNACEEASILLVANTYYEHNWTKEQFRDQILALVDWENKTFGYYKSTTTQQMTKILEDFLKLKTVIHSNPTFAEVQAILAQGHLIVIPLAGKELGNPNFTNGGPEYHALVIKGYKRDQKVITEDVGTQHGEDYVYTWQTIFSANHDYAKPMGKGAKLLIEVLPPSQK